MSPFVKDAAVVRSRRTWLAVVGWTMLVACFVPIFVPSVITSPSGVALLAYCLTTLGALHAWRRWWREQSGRVRADESGLWLGDRCVVRRGSVRHGYAIKRVGGTCVRLVRRTGVLEVDVADEAEGEALLHAMRLDAARSVGQYSMTHGGRRASFGRAVGSALPIVIAPAVAFLAGGTLTMLAIALPVAALLTILYASNQHSGSRLEPTASSFEGCCSDRGSLRSPPSTPSTPTAATSPSDFATGPGSRCIIPRAGRATVRSAPTVRPPRARWWSASPSRSRRIVHRRVRTRPSSRARAARQTTGYATW